MKPIYAVRLADTEREQVQSLIASETAPARKLMHARVLLKADQSPQGPAWTDDAIDQLVDVSQPTVFRMHRHAVEQGLRATLERQPSTREHVRKLDGAQSVTCPVRTDVSTVWDVEEKRNARYVPCQ
jgi:hypothetical protein